VLLIRFCRRCSGFSPTRVLRALVKFVSLASVSLRSRMEQEINVLGDLDLRLLPALIENHPANKIITTAQQT